MGTNPPTDSRPRSFATQSYVRPVTGVFIPLFLEGAAALTSELHPGKIVQFVRKNRISVIVCVPRIFENLKNEMERYGTTSEPNVRASITNRIWRHRRIHRRF